MRCIRKNFKMNKPKPYIHNILTFIIQLIMFLIFFVGLEILKSRGFQGEQLKGYVFTYLALQIGYIIGVTMSIIYIYKDNVRRWKMCFSFCYTISIIYIVLSAIKIFFKR